MTIEEKVSIPCELVFRRPLSSKLGPAIVCSDELLRGTAVLSLSHDRCDLTLTVDFDNKEDRKCVRKIPLKNIVSVTVKMAKDGLPTLAKNNVGDDSNAQQQSSFFRSFICLKLVDFSEVEICGISAADTSLLFDVLHNTAWQKQETEGAIVEDSLISPLDRYIASKSSLITSSSLTRMPSLATERVFDRCFQDTAAVTLKISQENKYAKLLQKNVEEQEGANNLCGLTSDNSQGSAILHLTRVGIFLAQRKNFTDVQNNLTCLPKIEDNTSTCPPLSYPDPFDPSILYTLRNSTLSPCCSNTRVADVGCTNNNDNDYHNDDGVCICCDTFNSSPSAWLREGRETYVLNKLKERSLYIEKMRAELCAMREKAEFEAEQRSKEEEKLLEGYKNLTPAQRALLNFDTLLEPVITLKEFMEQGIENLEKRRLQLGKGHLSLFVRQLFELSLPHGDDAVQQASSTTFAADEVISRSLCEHYIAKDTS